MSRFESGEAAKKSKPARLLDKGVLALGVGHAVHDTYTAFLPPLLPVFIQNLLLSRTEAGLLNVFMQIPSLIQPVIGHWADRINLRFMVFVAPAATAVTMSLLGADWGYAGLSAILFLAGLSSAAMHAVGPVEVGHLSSSKLGRGMSVWMVGGELGRTLGPLIVVAAVTHWTLTNLPWLMIGGLVLSFWLFLRIGNVRREPAERKNWARALKGMRGILLPLTGIITFRAFLVMSMTVFLPTYMTDEGGSLWMAGAGLTVFQAAGMIGALFGGSLSDRFGRKKVLALSMVGASAFLFLFLYSRGWMQMASLFLSGLFLLSITPVKMALVQEHFPENRALANGMYMGLSFVIRSAVVILIGWIGDRAGLRLAFTLSGAILILALPFVALLPGKPSAGSGSFFSGAKHGQA